MHLHVCSLSRLADTVEATGARHVVTLINAATPVARPTVIAPEDHLFLGMNDIVTPMEGYEAPGETHVRELLSFAERWWAEGTRATPLVVHCWAGISRSTAGAFVAACALNPHRNEAHLADLIRERSPSATPNRRIVAIADDIMGRKGRMVEAIDAIGRGADSFEGVPFHIALEA
ncbi:MAG: protein tyrosine phosphatase [Alphaproteobacteria bacterium]